MHIRRVAAFLIGAWLLGSLAMFFVATQNFQGVTRVLDVPSQKANARIEKLGADDARFLLRYQVSELNRQYFDSWERVQLVLGAILVALTLRGSQKLSILAIPVAMLLMVAVAHWLLTPEVTRLGRLMDFVQDARQTPDGQAFWRYHQIYSAMEVLKFLLGLYLAFTLLVRRRRRTIFSKKVSPQVNVIHNP
jgi:hypothetical protein